MGSRQRALWVVVLGAVLLYGACGLWLVLMLVPTWFLGRFR